MNETELVKKAQAGDFSAFTELIKKHQERIYSLARKLTGNNEDAEDIVQESLLKAIDKIDQFRLESSFGTWLYSIALNQARAFFASRKQVDLKPIEEYLPSRSKSGKAIDDNFKLYEWNDPEKLFESTELRKIIDNAISELPYIYKEAFLLRYEEELSVKDVAQMIGETVAAAKSRILRARLALREELSNIFEAKYDTKMS